MPDEKQSASFERTQASKILLGFLSTFLLAVASKVVTMVLASQTVTDIVVWLSDNYSFWIVSIVTSSAAGFFAQKWTKK